MTHDKQVEEDPAAKFGRIIESSLIGAIDFVLRFFRTMVNSVIAPSQIMEYLKQDQAVPKYTRPYTYFVISCLLASFTMGHESITPTFYGKSLFQSIDLGGDIYTPVNILATALPILIFIFPFLMIVGVILSHNACNLRSLNVRALCVASGTQLVFSFLTSLFIYGYSWWIKLNYTSDTDELVTKSDNAIISLGVIFLLGISLCASIPLVYKLFQLNHFKNNSKLNYSCLILACLVSVAIHGAYSMSPFGKRLVAMIIDLDSKTVMELEYGKVDGRVLNATASKTTGVIEITLAFTNKTGSTLIFEPSISTLSYSIDLLLRNDAALIGWTDAIITQWETGDPVIKIKPGDMIWLQVEGQPNSDLAADLQQIIRQHGEGVVRDNFFHCSLLFGEDTYYRFAVRCNGFIQLVD